MPHGPLVGALAECSLCCSPRRAPAVHPKKRDVNEGGEGDDCEDPVRAVQRGGTRRKPSQTRRTVSRQDTPTSAVRHPSRCGCRLRRLLSLSPVSSSSPVAPPLSYAASSVRSCTEGPSACWDYP